MPGTFSFPRLDSLLRNVAGWSSEWCSVGRGSSLKLWVGNTFAGRHYFEVTKLHLHVFVEWRIRLGRAVVRAASCWSHNVSPGLNPRRRCVGFVVDEVIIEQVILQAFRCSCVNVVPPTFRTGISFTFYPLCRAQSWHLTASFKSACNFSSCRPV